MIDSLFSTAFIHAWGWTLLHALWQGAAFALVLAVLLVLLRKYSPHARYVVAVGLLALFFGTVAATFTRLYHQVPPEATQVAASPLPDNASTSQSPTPAKPLSVTNAPAAPGFRAWLTEYYDRHLPLIVTLWLVGVLMLQLRFLGQLAFVQRLRSYGVVPLPESWHARIQTLEDRLRIRRKVRYLLSRRTDSPLTVGWLRPAVIFPQALFQELKEQQLIGILAHELAHVRRNDYLVNLLVVFLSNVFFYHPALWWMTARIEEEREHCCDDLAVAATGKPRHYAKTLVQLKELQARPARLAVAYTGAAGVPQGGFKTRVSRLFGRPFAGATYAEGFASSLLLFGGLALALLATAQTGRQAAGADSDTSPITVAVAPIPPIRVQTPILDTLPRPKLRVAAAAPPAVAESSAEPVLPNNHNSPKTDLPYAFRQAIYRHDTPQARRLIEQGLSVNAPDEKGFTPLMWAVNQNNRDIAALLLDRGANIDYVNAGRWTALIEAADEGATDCVRLLLERGARVDYPTGAFTRNAVYMAASEGHLDILQLLQTAGADLAQAGGLQIAAEEGNAQVVHYLLAQGLDIDAKDGFGRTALSYATEEDHPELVTFLLRNGADPNIRSITRHAALDYAVAEENHRIVEMLTSPAATAPAVETHQHDLQIACAEGRQSVVADLLAAGVDVEAAYDQGTTPLMIAAHRGELDVVRFLINHGDDVNATDPAGRTALMFAAAAGHDGVAALLVSRQADVNKTDREGKQALHYAREVGHEGLINFLGLITHTADTERITQKAEMAETRSRARRLDRLRADYGIESVDELLLAIVEAGDHRAMTELMAFGPNPGYTRPKSVTSQTTNQHSRQTTTVTITGWSAAHEAIAGGHVSILRSLLDAGWSLAATTPAYQQAVLIARNNNHQNLLDYLAQQE